MLTATTYSFYNTLWLIANDVIIGSALLTFLCENSDLLAELLTVFLKVGIGRFKLHPDFLHGI